jgi:inner membrane protein
MDNLTHSLVGLAASKAGLDRLSPATTAMCIVAANAPDGDIVATYWGRWAYLQHHRGITHSIIGAIALAVLIPTLFWLGDYLVARVRRRPPKVIFRGLLLASFIVTATHPILDWTNNYGVRPFLPWSSQWYYGDIVFIVDPWIWLGLGGACFLVTAKTKWRIGAWSLLAGIVTFAVVLLPMIRPNWIFPVPARVIWTVGILTIVVVHRARLAEKWGPAIPSAVFVLIVVYWTGLAILHQQAIHKAGQQAMAEASSQGETIGRLAAMPVLANPMRWQCVFETDRATYRFDYSLNEAQVVSKMVRFEKPSGEAYGLYAIGASDERSKVFLGFARFPVARIVGDCISETLVQLADLRYTEPGGGRRGTFSVEVPIECPPVNGAVPTK